ncbi:hypothetical protein EZV62_027725 [Acer yangbiense]|uniref:CCHC-type domain-containing protein n=1 Tax=Acer yangbiense TaxID=1000413 RepID=A0A5C7GUN1_9ROSI|nr:hypothetical protein EZV62_027725 [Acer yangbiense]
MSLTKREGPVRRLQGVLKEAGAKKLALCLAGKILSRESINREAFRSLIARIWKVQGGVEIEVISTNIYAFPFQSFDDRKRVFMGGPWSFDGALIVLEEPEGKGAINSLLFNSVDFWVHITNVPMIYMTKDIGKFLGSIIGEVREVDVGPSSDCLGKFMRVRVAVEVDKPLRRFLRVDVLGDGEETVMPIQYERLPSFCFLCGLVGHLVHECTSYGEDGLREGSGMVYGAWLRATAPLVQYGRGNWGGHVDMRNQGAFRQDPNVGHHTGEFNQRSWVKSGNARVPEGSSGKKTSGGISLVGDGSGGLVRSENVISGSNPSLNLNSDTSREPRPADKGKKVMIGMDVDFVFSSGKEKSPVKEGTDLIGKPNQGLVNGMLRVGDVGALNGPVGSSILETGVGQPIGRPVQSVVELDRCKVTQPERLSGVGSGSQNVLLSDEGIGPTMRSVISQPCSGVSGPAGRKWKRAARNKSMVSPPELNGVICSKRQILPAEVVFNGDAKKPRFDAYSEYVHAACFFLKGPNWKDNISFQDMFLFYSRSLGSFDLELLCTVWWRNWFWRNQKVHNNCVASMESVVSWATSFLEEYRVANLIPVSSPPSHSSSASIKLY